jgi:hypothetical protein
MSAHSDLNRSEERTVGVVTGLVDEGEVRRPLVGSPQIVAVAGGAVLGIQGLPGGDELRFLRGDGGRPWGVVPTVTTAADQRDGDQHPGDS